MTNDKPIKLSPLQKAIVEKMRLGFVIYQGNKYCWFQPDKSVIRMGDWVNKKAFSALCLKEIIWSGADDIYELTGLGKTIQL